MPISPSSLLTGDFRLFNQYPTTATLLSPSYIQDPGGSTQAIYKSAGTFSCRIQGPPSANEIDDHAFGKKSFYDARLFCSATVVLSEKDRVQIGTAVWDITGIDNVDSEDIYLEVALKRHV